MSLSPEDMALVSLLVREGIDEAILGGLAVPVKRPGTTVLDIAAGGVGFVLLDGDANSIQATNITGLSLSATTRVLVEITPAGAVWISNPLGSAFEVPFGVAFPYFGDTAPERFAFSYGQTLTGGVALYPNLAAALAPAFISGANIVMPDLRGRVTVGLDNMGGSDAGRLSVANTLGLGIGHQNLQLHAHLQTSHTHGVGSADNFVIDGSGTAFMAAAGAFGPFDIAAATAGNLSEDTANAGTGTGENIQPGILGNWIMRLL